MGFTYRCLSKAGYRNCVNLAWPANYVAYDRAVFTPTYWHGTIHEDKQDGNGLFYRRKRYYDGSRGAVLPDPALMLAPG